MVILSDYLIPFLLVLTVLVFVHEFGHYIVARLVGVHVEVFSIGFGPEIVGRTDRVGTRWKFSAIPLGGYVKMLGDANMASQPDSDAPFTAAEKARAFPFKRLDQRTSVVAAGPISNFLFAIIALAIVFAVHGQPFTPPVVGSVQPDSAAAAAGFQAGDRIESINGGPVARFEDVQRVVRRHPGESLRIEVRRDDGTTMLSATPNRRTVTDRFGNQHTIGLLGVTRSGVSYRRLGPVAALSTGASETAAVAGATLQAIGEIVLGQRSADQLGGPVKIAEMSGEVAESGWYDFVWFLAVLSINLGLINLFPVPMLDGGHLLFYAIEAVRGRPLGQRAQEYGFRLGFALVVTLLLLVTWKDLLQIT